MRGRHRAGSRQGLARRACALAGASLLAMASSGLASATPHAAPEAVEPAERRLRVGTSGDYAPWSVLDGAERSGFDISVAEAYAAERGLEIEWVPFRWPALLDDLEAGRFDVAMSGVTVRAERSAAGAFTVPIASSGAVVLLQQQSPVAGIDDLDSPNVVIAVNAGGHLEHVTRSHFAKAQIRAVADNAAVLDALRGGAHAVVTDTSEAPYWQARTPGLRLLGPFTRDAKAYLVSASRRDLSGDLDSWILDREQDGTLQRLRSEHLGGAAEPPPAAPLPALVASMRERLALMPLVAESKRAAGSPVHVPDQEDRVLEAAVMASWAAAAVEQRQVPDADAVRRLFRAQIAAARVVQEQTLAGDPANAEDAPSLESLRGGLQRIGDRIAGLLARIPAELDAASVRAQVAAGLAPASLPEPVLSEIAEAIVAVAEAPRTSP